MEHIIEKWEELLEFGGTKKDIACLIISGIALLCSIFGIQPFPFDIAWVAIVLCGFPIISEAIIGMITAFDIKADVLVSLALIASVIIGEHFAAGEVAFIMQIGGLLEELTVAKARAGIEKLVQLTPQTARLIKRGQEEVSERMIPAQDVEVGDILRVLPGETIPVDGIIIKGQTSINQAVMTGESMPVDKTEGDEVSSGTVNQFGTFEMQAKKVGEDSSLQRMIRLVQSADAGKAKIVGLADRWATWIVIIALTAAALTWLITGEIIRAVTILVVFCPCALVLATPTAIMAGIGNATKHGFLVKEGDALERLSTVKRITFDKTGTLTIGKPVVVNIESFNDNYTSDQIYQLTASAESLSEHPLGKAVTNCYKDNNGTLISKIEDFLMIPGEGLTAIVNGTKVAAGNLKLMDAEKIEIPEKASEEMLNYLEKGCTLIYVGLQNQFAGVIALSDTMRPDAEKMIQKLHQLNIAPVLLTGDHENAAKTIAGQLGIKDVFAGCLPEDKLHAIIDYENAGQAVCMIGDGINDAPALKKASVGIAMGGVGSDIAVDAADIALVNDDVSELPHLLALSKKLMVTIKYNLAFSLTLNFIAIILAMTGILNPVVGALVHNCGSVLVIINSILLLKWKG